MSKFEIFQDWIPVRTFYRENEVFVDWCYLGKTRLDDPFFDDSILKRFREPFNLLFQHQTPIEFLGEMFEFSKGIVPTGFIFHLSRCGSTLISQMLAALDRNIVISEASPIDFVLRKAKVDDETRILWLRWMINALGQKRNPQEDRFFIKFDSWNTLEIEIVKRAFPDVPWIFLYRDPVEIIVSHIEQRGAHMVPGFVPEILPEMSFEDSIRIAPEEFCARVLGKICQSSLEPLKNNEGLPVNYLQLPHELKDICGRHFNVEYSAREHEKMLAASKFNAKNRAFGFTGDSERKQKSADKTVTVAAEKYVNPYYEELESIRKNSQKPCL